MTGGFCALIAAIAIGPRKGFYGHGENVKAQLKGSNELLCALGVSILWFGWYGFNCGSTLGAGTKGAIYVAGRVAVNTTLGAGISCLVATIVSKNILGFYDLTFCLNGLLAGLVSITASCAVVETWGAIIIGVIGSLIYIGVKHLVKKGKVDDPLDAFAVHGACGAWGCLAVGIFATRTNILRAYGFDNDAVESGNQFRNQVIGVLCITAWTLMTSSLVFFPLKRAGLLRVPAKAERLGLDVAEHGVPFRNQQQSMMEIKRAEGESRAQSNTNPFGNFARSVQKSMTAFGLNPIPTSAGVPRLTPSHAASGGHGHTGSYHGTPYMHTDSTTGVPTNRVTGSSRSPANRVDPNVSSFRKPVNGGADSPATSSRAV